MSRLCGGVRVFDGPVFDAHAGPSKTPTLPPSRTNSVDNPVGPRHVVSSEEHSRVNSLAELSSARVNSLFVCSSKAL